MNKKSHSRLKPAPASVLRGKIKDAVAGGICHGLEAFLTEHNPSEKHRLMNECHAMLLQEIHGWPESERAKVIREAESQILFHARRLVELAHSPTEKARAQKIKRAVTAALATGQGRARWN
jgi:hypothetical protein